MKALLQYFLFVALTLGLAQGRPLSALPSADAHTMAAPVISGAPLPAPSPALAAPPAVQSLDGAAPAAPIPPELRAGGDPDIPMKGSPLLLLSIIGFGLLIGGIVPAMRPRKITGTHP